MNKCQTRCPDCCAVVSGEDGPSHEYLPASPGCWKVYGEVLAREYSDREYWKVHRLTVDAYSAQHPSGDDPRQIQSLSVHLLALYLAFEKKMPEDQIRKGMEFAIQKNKGLFKKLSPPSFEQTLKVTDVIQANGALEHQNLVNRWARDVWNAWSAEHLYIAGLANF